MTNSAWTQGGKGKPPTHAAAPANLEEELKLLFGKVLVYDEELITKKSRLLEDMEADSLDTVELCTEMEEQLGLVVDDDEDLDRLRTFGDWLRLATRLQKAKGKAATDGSTATGS